MTTRNSKSDETEQKQLFSMKPLFWISSSKKDLKSFPDEVKNVLGTSLHYAQRGGKANDAKPLKRFKGSGVLEIVDDFQTDRHVSMCLYSKNERGRLCASFVSKEVEKGNFHAS